MAGGKTNDFRSRPRELMPREKMRRAASVRDVETEALLAVMLKTGAVGCDVETLSRRLLKAAGSLARLVKCDWRELEALVRSYNAAHPEAPVRGIGPAKILDLAAAFELVRRGYDVAGDDVRRCAVRTARDAEAVFRRALSRDDEQENFLVLPLDSKNHPLCEPLRVTRGTLDKSPVHGREVFRDAIRWGAYAVMVAHNHPSGDPTPSADDVVVTRRLVEVSKVVGIPLLDHLVLGRGRFVSIRSAGAVAF